jgi:hypothetical protein
LTPLSVTLEPGYYALIFGSGQLCASGLAFMALSPDQIDLPGSSYFSSNGSNWVNESISHVRFVVKGQN